MGVGDLSDSDASPSLWAVDVASIVGMRVESMVHEVRGGFTSAIATWNAHTDGGSWIEIDLRARVADRWTRWYSMGRWSSGPAGEHRRSVAGQSDADGTVDTDVLELRKAAGAVQIAADLHSDLGASAPEVRFLAVATDGERSSGATQTSAGGRARGIDIDVPAMTQRTGSPIGVYGGGGDSWCSPASVAMVMGYWSRLHDRTDWAVDVETAAMGTYDSEYGGCGNWAFSVAFASERGLAGWVQRLASLDDVETYVAAGIPVIASIRVAPGSLTGSPYPETDGHLLVVRGFTSDGHPIVNEPYAESAAIRRVYDRGQLEHAWQAGSRGAVYVIAPPDALHAVP
jgi:hypothetical protein